MAPAATSMLVLLVNARAGLIAGFKMLKEIRSICAAILPSKA